MRRLQALFSADFFSALHIELLGFAALIERGRFCYKRYFTSLSV